MPTKGLKGAIAPNFFEYFLQHLRQENLVTSYYHVNVNVNVFLLW